MSTADDAPKIHVDSDWKAEAQAEKQRLASAEQAPGRKGGGRARAGELPPADFRTLIGVLASQAIMGLGAIGDSKTGRIVVDLPGAQFSIDLLAVLEQKTRGNLDDEERKELEQVLAELRARYVEISQLIARQGVAPPEGRAGTGPIKGISGAGAGGGGKGGGKPQRP